MNQTEPNSLRPGDATHLAHAPLKTTSLPAEWGAARNCIALNSDCLVGQGVPICELFAGKLDCSIVGDYSPHFFMR